jgi:hypothetical protein
LAAHNKNPKITPSGISADNTNERNARALFVLSGTTWMFSSPLGTQPQCGQMIALSSTTLKHFEQIIFSLLLA